MKATARDVDVMARTIYGEARGQHYNGQLAVGYVILNRVALKGWMGKTIAGVCQKKWQFSCWNGQIAPKYEDANYRAILKAHLGLPAFRETMQATLEVIMDSFDVTEGATHYHTIAQPRYAKYWPPTWANGATKTVKIGDHQFYKDVP